MVRVTSNLPDGPDVTEEDIERWLDGLPTEYGPKVVAQIHEACELVRRAAADSARTPTGELPLRHALAVTELLARLGLDRETLLTSVLQPLAGDFRGVPDGLRERFGPGVVRLSEDLARVDALVRERMADPGSLDETSAESFRRMLLGTVRDVRVFLVVVASQLHRMRSSKKLSDPLRRRLAEETLVLYSPLANRLGIGQIKWELEDLALRYLEPERYREIASLLDGKRRDREGFIHLCMAQLREGLAAQGIRAEITGRPKHIFSIWKKMHRKSLPFEQIFDVLALRVLVDEIADCYAVLGIIHSLWEPIEGEFDDYIVRPKINMYQSLHTAVRGPEGKPIEIQIRTWDMHRHAELGVAAHWRYKENARHDADFERRIQWMRHWLELRDEAPQAEASASGFGIGTELEPESVYVFSPQGRVVELPRQATPLDFAYAIHSDLGHRCRGARVDGRMVQLTTPLQTGQTVEILAAKEGGPSRDWLNPHAGYLHTSKARSRVRQWFKRQEHDRDVAAGRVLFERESVRHGIQEKLDPGAGAARFNFKRGEDVLAAIGRGELTVAQVLGVLAPRAPSAPEEPPPEIRHPAPRRQARGEIQVGGMDDMLCQMARCCKPVPRDPIIGFVTRGRGVTVHRTDCPNVLRMRDDDKARLVDVQWTSQRKEASYAVDLLVRAADRKGLLRDVSAVLTDEDVNVIGVRSFSDRTGDIATMRFTIEIGDVSQLKRLLTKVAQMPEVLDVRRHG